MKDAARHVIYTLAIHALFRSGEAAGEGMGQSVYGRKLVERAKPALLSKLR